jgi:serine/threonine protein kinase
MILEAGARLGPYEIVAPLGAGGMGEVYKARDTRLDRNLAIKILPADVARDLNRRERFRREARVISQLTHPHICTLHDIGDHNGFEFIVMEYLPGRDPRAPVAPRRAAARRCANGQSETILRRGPKSARAIGVFLHAIRSLTSLKPQTSWLSYRKSRVCG